ncbi:MAG: heme d1 biosynthesis radical SAM protein NirJ1 [Leptospiraceae bacterium]|nr:MAG: heme d1 biosynthesis radical SAM protein NirJ1 [Leptospiraceae bacterium]
MSCPHCYASAKKRKKETKELSTQEAEFIIKQLYDYGIKVLIFSGGEPLLRQDLFHLIELSSNLGFQCHLSTNGVLINEKNAEKLKQLKIFYVGISIDGLPEFNDKYRGLNRAFEKAFMAFRYLKENQIMTGLRITLSKANKDQLLPLIDYALEHNIDRFYISHLLYSGRGENIQNDDLSTEEAKQIMWQIFQLADQFLSENKHIRFVSGGNDVDCALLYLYTKEKYGERKANQIKILLEKRKGNSAGEKIINIDHLGNVHPDQFWRNYTAGNLLENTLEEIMQDSLFLQLKEREKYLKDCKECPFLMMCRGSHRERALAVYHDLWAIDPACYLKDFRNISNKNPNKKIYGVAI